MATKTDEIITRIAQEAITAIVEIVEAETSEMTKEKQHAVYIAAIALIEGLLGRSLDEYQSQLVAGAIKANVENLQNTTKMVGRFRDFNPGQRPS